MGEMYIHADPHFIWPVQHDRHVKDWKWAQFMKNVYGLEVKGK